jgi:rhamnulokinase
MGNVLVQARAYGAVDGDLDDLRALVRRTGDMTRYEPRVSDAAWADAERRVYD